jgi:uroporphyrinogen decarboxylase
VAQTAQPLLATLLGEKTARPPVWMMRQAGRHLPEYRDLRRQARDFLDFCYSPSLACEATLQPVRRYGMDGAILFADILLILDALGRNVRFLEGEGPLVDPASTARDLAGVSLSRAMDRLSCVGETVERVAEKLPAAATLIGFAGAPWTVAVYAVEGKGGGDKSIARRFGYSRPDELKGMLDILVETSAHYLAMQARAGASALMLFDSWAEGLTEEAYRSWIIEPTAALMRRLRELGVSTPVIGFPRGSGALIAAYASQSGVDAVGLDTAVPTRWADATLPAGMPVQGNLDPLLLAAGGPGLAQAVRRILSDFHNRPHIFNLGHGVVPDTPIANVEAVVRLVRGETG